MRNLPRRWSSFVMARNLFAASSILTLYVIAVGATIVQIPLWLSVALFVSLVGWSCIGASKYEKGPELAVASLVLFPILHTINALGVVYGMIRPTSEFEVTEKR